MSIAIATAGPVTLTGIVTETGMAALRIPGGTIGPNGLIEVRTLWSCTNSANNKILSIRFSATPGAITLQPGVQTMLTTSASAQGLWIIANVGATNTQIGYANAGGVIITPYGTINAAPVSGAIDTTVDAWVNVNGIIAAAGETLTLQHCAVVIFPA